MQKSIKDRIIVIDFVAILVFAINTIPALKEYLSNWMVVGLILLWLVSTRSIRYDNRFERKWQETLFSWMVIGTMITFFSGNIRFLKNYIFELLSFVFPFMVFMSVRHDSARVKTILKWITLLFIIANVTALYSYIDSKSVYTRRTEDVYSVVYATVALCLINLYGFVKHKGEMPKIERLFNLLVTVLCYAAVLLSGFTLACILLVSLSSVLFVLLLGKTKRQRATLVCVVIITIVILLVNLENILLELANIVRNRVYIDRIHDMLETISGQGVSSTSTVASRLDKYYISLRSITDHPIIGRIWYVNDNTPVLSVIGYHSTILDNIGLFGIIIGIFPIYILLYPLCACIRHYKSELLVTTIVSVYAFALLILNNEIPNLGIVLYFFLPGKASITVTNRRI